MTSDEPPRNGSTKQTAESANPAAMPTHLSEEELEARMSYADLQRRHAHPRFILATIIALTIAVVAPYAAGRWLAFNRTKELTDFLQHFDPRGVALVSWSVTAFGLMAIVLLFLSRHRVTWTVVFTLMLAAEQFIAGFGLLRWDFAYSTRAVYGQASVEVNAADMGILAAVLALAVFVIAFVLILVIVRKDSPLNVLTEDWAALTMYWVVEGAGLAILLAMLSSAG